MNREASPLALSPDQAALRSTPYQAPMRGYQRSIGETELPSSTDKREATLMIGLWLVIGLVAAYDTYLSIKFQETLPFQELNPMGRWLMAYDGGSVATFMGCKFLGTSIALGVLQLLYYHWRRVGLFVAGGVAGLQILLCLYLTLG